MYEKTTKNSYIINYIKNNSFYRYVIIKLLYKKGRTIKMKTIITTLNSKFIHSALSIRYLKSFLKGIPNVTVQEYTINQNSDFIAGELYKQRPDIVAFSCYIWNITNTLTICESLKIINPDIKIILGGPEVSFDGEELLKKHEYIDFIVYGEGEETFKELIISIIDADNDYKKIKGLIYREGEKIMVNEPRPLIQNLDIIPSPYDYMTKELENKIVYFESSRGCPFNCKFCLSSTIKGVRFFSLDRVKSDLEKLIDGKVRQVKFVDRTFNTNKEYAMEIMKFIIDKNPENMNFHFEVTAHLVDDEMLEFLKDVKEGLFQFEIGVQSTNPKTIEAIGRTTNFEKLKRVTKTIMGYGNIHQHLDLIAGLPYEDYTSFKTSFNDVYVLRPEKLQLGFLKLLKGSDLRCEKDLYGLKFLDKPPYEVLETNHISYDEMLRLKIIEDLLEKYGNEHYFENSIQFIINNFYGSPFELYEDFAYFWEEKGYHRVFHSREKLYNILYKFYVDNIQRDLDTFNEIIKFDYICNNKNPNIPKYLKRYNVSEVQDKKHEFFKKDENLLKYLPSYKDESTRQIINNTHYELFKFNVLDLKQNNYNNKSSYKEDTIILFDYRKNKVLSKCEAYNITEEFNKL